MDDGAQVRIIELAHQFALLGQPHDLDPKIAAARFRAFYRHFAVTVDLAADFSTGADGARVLSDKELEQLS